MGCRCHSDIAWQYFSFFDCGRDTHFCSRSYVKPANVIVKSNGTSFVASQGIPNCVVASLMSSSSYGKMVCWFWWSQMCFIRKVKCSAKCSAPMSARTLPLYHSHPPVWSFPPLDAMMFRFVSLSSLYRTMVLQGILKNKKSSTHLSIGPIPLACSKSARASLNRPNKLPAVAPPKLLLMLSANCFGWFKIRTTTPGHWFLCSGMIL